jgi:phospholipase/carboxylesterase
MKLTGPSLIPANSPNKIVVFLHGLGADGNDLIGLADEFSETLPNAVFFSPNAPFPCDMAPYGYQWFSLQSWSVDSMLNGLAVAAPMLNDFLDSKLAEYNLEDKDMYLVGFSQGTMTALYTALRRGKPCGGVIGFSGALADDGRLEVEIKSKPRVCLIHGMMDMVVPFSALSLAERSLELLGVDVEAHSRPLLGHGIDSEGLKIARNFLKQNSM